jgi:UDP-N-acetylglucosamine--N-acetylmuramyl-(pentapeptide) pyrophosphoryl-undecaprenol N-acetylglucosamine transferase
MLVASPGGHLDELRILVDLLGVDQSDTVWVTGRTAQTESLLEGDEVVWLPRVGSGEMRKAALGLPAALRLHRRIRPELVVSTGALFSTPHLVAASTLGAETWFIDSATRVAGPSRTGVFAQRFTRAKLFVQGDGWGDDRWTRVPSVFDAFEPVARPNPLPPDRLRTAVVSLGTELWPFDRAVERVLGLLPDTDIVWQTGTTVATHNGATLPQWLPATELHRAFRDSDVVITHAGVGSALAALDQGKVPVVLPRRQAHREMIDDHQVEFADMMAARSLAVSVDPADLTWDHLHRAANLTARRRTFS